MQNKFSNNEPYAPAEDTYFLEDNILNEKGNYALDIGTGTGYLTRTLSKNFSYVSGTDIDFNSVRKVLQPIPHCNVSHRPGNDIGDN